MTDATGDEAARLDRLAVLFSGAAGQAPHVDELGRRHFLVPDAFSLKAVDPLEPRLLRVHQTVQMASAASFVDYVKRFTLPTLSVIFADRAKKSVRAVFDWHDSGGILEMPQPSHAPGRKAHRALFSPPVSEEWTRWTSIHRKPVPQAEFCDFLEENCQDVVTPAAADLLDMVANFRDSRATKFERGVRLQDGTVRLTYHEESVSTAGRGHINVPSEIEIAVPVFLGEPRTAVRVLLRHRTADGALSFVPVIHRRELIEDALFCELLATIAAETGLTVWHGTAD